MAGKERRRVHAQTDLLGSSGRSDTIATVDEANAVNVHGVRFSFVVEPENADANANGNWVLWCLPRISTAIPTSSTTALELEADNPVVWAIGTFAASNQTPYCHEVSLGTSRNCPAGTRIVLAVDMEGISAGNARVRSILTYFTRSL